MTCREIEQCRLEAARGRSDGTWGKGDSVVDLSAARLQRISGAVSGQLSQAVLSFVLLLVAAHSLGAAGLGRFALVLSAMVTLTALCNGLVGDSLIVLDRHNPEIRAGLQAWLLVAAFGAGIVAALLFWWAG